ncbi:MAG: hypothetical protein AAF196_17025 [Planctomycetota bacterium]
MTINRHFGSLHDRLTVVRDFDPTAVNGTASPVQNSANGVRWIDLGEGPPTGQSQREKVRFKGAVDIEVAGFTAGAGAGNVEVHVVYSEDGSAVAARQVIARYEDATKPDFIDKLPFSNQSQGAVYRYVGVELVLSANDVALSTGFAVVPMK